MLAGGRLLRMHRGAGGGLGCWGVLHQCFQCLDQPSSPGSELLQMLLCPLAKRVGCRVVLRLRALVGHK